MSNVKSTTQVRAVERFSYKRIQGLKYKTVFNNGYSQGITSAQKTFNKISHVAVLRWLPIGAIFLGIIAVVKNAESRFDSCCSGAKSENNHLVRGKCFHLYRKQYQIRCFCLWLRDHQFRHLDNFCYIPPNSGTYSRSTVVKHS